MRPWDPDREPDQRDAARGGEDAGQVASLHAVRAQVRDVEHPVDERERAEAERERRAQPGPQPREGEDACDRGEQGQRAGERVLAEAEARSAVDERVVQSVDQPGRGGAGEHQRLRGSIPSARPARCGASRRGGDHASVPRAYS
jgi:hypothetical protein